MGEFRTFSQAVASQFANMSKGELFVVDVEDIYASYLAAFPEGSNPIFRTRTEHDCSCCKNFIRNVGAVVSIDGSGNIVTVWDDFPTLEEPYGTVARAMANLVRQQPIKTIYRTKMAQYGNESTKELLEDNTVRNWNHFVGVIDRKHRSDDADTVRGQIEAAAQVLRRGLEELSLGAIDTVLDLINTQGGLYRGEEHKPAVVAFRALKVAFDAAPDKTMFVWGNIENRAARFRNTVIGTLVTDLSTGVELERAVRSFETKVAPANYKRTSALITKPMVDKAMAKLKELGLEGAVHRRFTKIEDVSVNDVLFVDNAVKDVMQDGLVDLLMTAVKTKPRLSAKVDITADEFLSTVVPNADRIEVLVENKHAGNFVSLTAPVEADTGKLFKWDNDFAWSYEGEVTDSIKSRVKAAGGNINALLRVSLAWFNKDDLDIHCHTPSGQHIGYFSKQGILDVDMNAGGPTSRTPVENLAFQRLEDGIYRIEVNQYSRREMADPGFTLEVEFGGVVQQFNYAKGVSGTIKALSLQIRNGQLVTIVAGTGVVGGNTPVEKWGISTETLVPVDTLMFSPNHWGGKEIGNRHLFFILRGCKNPDPARGIYNEFLRSSLDEHRKVFEVLGSKTKCPPTDEQVSGVGFSANRGDKVTVKVNGSRTYNITF